MTNTTLKPVATKHNNRNVYAAVVGLRHYRVIFETEATASLDGPGWYADEGSFGLWEAAPVNNGTRKPFTTMRAAKAALTEYIRARHG